MTPAGGVDYNPDRSGFPLRSNISRAGGIGDMLKKTVLMTPAGTNGRG